MCVVKEFKAFHESFNWITGPKPALELLLEKPYPFAFEAGIYKASRRELFITSSPIDTPVGDIIYASGSRKTVIISKISWVSDATGKIKIAHDILPNGLIAMANGGTNADEDDSEVLFCAQGSQQNPSGIFAMSTTSPYSTRQVLKDFYGRPFNSVNDVVVHPQDGSIWFTDPAYGYGEGYRPKPRLPNQVYRYDPSTNSVRLIADGFGHPNGICFSPDLGTVYITDTDLIWGDGSLDETRSSTIYAFDVIYRGHEPFLANRRTFAMPDQGFPDGIKCDTEGNVYSGCGDGVHVWSPGGVPVGKILVDGGVANLCFGAPGELFILNGTKLWRALLADGIQGASPRRTAIPV